MVQKDRPKVVNGKTLKIPTPCGSFFLTLNYDGGELIEVMPRMGKSGNCIRSLLEHLGVLYSLLLQSGIGKERFEKIMKKYCIGVNCGTPFVFEGKTYTGCLDFMAQEIMAEKDETKKEKPE